MMSTFVELQLTTTCDDRRAVVKFPKLSSGPLGREFPREASLILEIPARESELGLKQPLLVVTDMATPVYRPIASNNILSYVPHYVKT